MSDRIVFCPQCGKIIGGPNCRCWEPKKEHSMSGSIQPTFDEMIQLARGLGSFVYGKSGRKADLSIEGNFTQIRLSEPTIKEGGINVQCAEGCGSQPNPLRAFEEAKKAFDDSYAKNRLERMTFAEAFKIIANRKGRVTITPVDPGFAIRVDLPEFVTFSKTPVEPDKILDYLKSVIVENELYKT